MFERPSGGDAAIMVSVDFGDHDYEESLHELRQLSLSAGLTIRGTVETKRSSPDAKHFIGSGKADELSQMMQASESNIAVFNHDLSPSQQRNLERLLKALVVDRTGLILDIFSQRAQSHEGKLQVELAQLEHLSTRLVRGWTHLERQKGGIGVRGGPGETQLELDRRMLRVRVKQLREKLVKLKAQRGMQRRARKRSNVMTVSLVGYTNAGKSTIFNRLTKADIYVADQLFATLDTTTHKIFIADCGSVVLSDTVGFIKHLPHALVEAFSATLEEAVQADLLLHIVDTASTNRDEQIMQVNKVLLEIGAGNVPQILVHNQIDRVGLMPAISRDEYGRITSIHVSALTGEGMDLLRMVMAEHSQHLQKMSTEESAYA
ncbi:MAG: GTPase HflX [Methylotenera sp.]|nr:GTPase HflX [Methylotenera sp.]MSP99291.1 GTPase HflX [Methylotenera sp.]